MEWDDMCFILLKSKESREWHMLVFQILSANYSYTEWNEEALFCLSFLRSKYDLSTWESPEMRIPTKDKVLLPEEDVALMFAGGIKNILLFPVLAVI